MPFKVWAYFLHEKHQDPSSLFCFFKHGTTSSNLPTENSTFPSIRSSSWCFRNATHGAWPCHLSLVLCCAKPLCSLSTLPRQIRFCSQQIITELHLKSIQYLCSHEFRVRLAKGIALGTSNSLFNHRTRIARHLPWERCSLPVPEHFSRIIRVLFLQMRPEFISHVPFDPKYSSAKGTSCLWHGRLSLEVLGQLPSHLYQCKSGVTLVKSVELHWGKAGEKGRIQHCVSNMLFRAGYFLDLEHSSGVWCYGVREICPSVVVLLLEHGGFNACWWQGSSWMKLLVNMKSWIDSLNK